MTISTDDNQPPRCAAEASLEEVRTSENEWRRRLNLITETRHGQIAVYPQDHMKRLLVGEAKAPLLRRLLRKLRLTR